MYVVICMFACMYMYACMYVFIYVAICTIVYIHVHMWFYLYCIFTLCFDPQKNWCYFLYLNELGIWKSVLN